jgi:hypothetical protein
MQEARRHALIFPREHGAWGILLVPLVSGAAAGLLAGGRVLPLLWLTLAALALFWMRTPVESWWGTTPMRAQPGAELRLVRRAVLLLAGVAGVALAAIFWGGRNADLAWIGAAAGLSFLVQALLRKRARVTAQIVGAAGLTATAPAAFYLATGHLTAMAWSLWAANLLFAANQIQFVQLRIHTRPGMDKLVAGRGFLVAQAGAVMLVALSSAYGWFSWYAAIAFVPMVLRGFLWFFSKPGPLALRRLGWTELTLAVGFGALLVSGLYLG